MHPACKIQPSYYTFFSLGIKIIEDSYKKNQEQCFPHGRKTIFTIRIAGHNLCSFAPLF